MEIEEDQKKSRESETEERGVIKKRKGEGGKISRSKGREQGKAEEKIKMHLGKKRRGMANVA